jgi:nucleotide-binding universal stress UspA family protein
VERVLLYVEDTAGMPAAVGWALRLAKGMSCRVFALSVINPDLPHRRDARTSDAEERAWSLLYEIEDEAFQKNVRISLLLETGEPLEELVSLSNSYDAELIIVSADCRLMVAELVRQSSRPVVFVK